MAKPTEKPVEEPTPEPTKEETPSWGKQLMTQLASLGDRLTTLEQTKETEKPVVQIPVPAKPKPPEKEEEQQEPAQTEPAPKRRGLLDLLW